MGDHTSADYTIDALKSIYQVLLLVSTLGKNYIEGLLDQILLDIVKMEVFNVRSMNYSVMTSRFLLQKSYFNILFHLIFSGELHFLNNIAQEDFQKLSFKKNPPQKII